MFKFGRITRVDIYSILTLTITIFVFVMVTVGFMCIARDCKLLGVWKDSSQDFYIRFDSTYQYTDSLSGEYNRFEIESGRVKLYDKYNQVSYCRFLSETRDSMELTVNGEIHILQKCNTIIEWEDVVNEA